MLQREIVRFRASDTQPNPLEVDYWIDVTSNYYGGCIRYYRNDTNTWEMLDLNDKQNEAITEIRNELAEFKNELKEEVNKLWQYINQKVEELTTQINDIRNEINDIKGDVNNIKQDITNINNNIDDINQDITNINSNIEDIRQDITNIENNLGNVGELLDEEYITQLINKLISENKISVLDPVQQAMNKGTGVVLALPSANNGKISLPIWTGTEAEYNQLTKVAGMTYNIIDEESE